MEQKNTSIMPLSIVDSKSALELAETKDIIDKFWIDLCGLAEIQSSATNKSYIRVSKPKMTYEFAKDITSNIYIEVNRLTARTDFDKLQIESYLYKQCDTMADWFASEGMNNLISPRVWEICLELTQEDSEAELIEIRGKKLVPNFWYTRFGIYWEYNSPFNVDMLNIIKRNFNLQKEVFGQAIILRNIFWSIRIFIHGGLNRSKDHLTLDHEKVIHKENTSFSGPSETQQSEGMLEKIKNKITSLGGLRK